MSNENHEAKDPQGSSEVLAVFSQLARNASEAEAPDEAGAAGVEARPRRMDRSEVLAVFSQLARNAGEAEAPDEAGAA